ncbi:MAG: hypothetical protein J6W22_12990 [Fibrobacter sp.]|nr:hypothetical protein [Fibrobacter sp.]
MLIRQYNETDLAAMIYIWNEMIEEYIAFTHYARKQQDYACIIIAEP